MEKLCRRCGVVKPVGEFRKAATGKGCGLGLFSYCNPCAREYRVEWGQRNRERIELSRVRRLYGLSELQWRELHERASGCCESCGVDFGGRAPSIEHDHVSGLVRGLVCQRCNIAIGVLEDAELLASVREFLARDSYRGLAEVREGPSVLREYPVAQEASSGSS